MALRKHLIAFSLFWLSASLSLAHMGHEDKTDYSELEMNSDHQHLIRDTHNIIEGSDFNFDKIQQLAKDQRNSLIIMLFYARKYKL